MTMPNPFEELAGSLAVLTAKVDALAAKLGRPQAEWEPINLAVKTRRRSRRTLMWAVKEGRIETKTVPSKRGRYQTLLRTRDLDDLFPVLPE